MQDMPSKSTDSLGRKAGRYMRAKRKGKQMKIEIEYCVV